MNLTDIAKTLQNFGGPNLTGTLSKIEASIKGATAEACLSVLQDAGANGEALTAAAALKRLAGQINVAIHAIGILLCLPKLLERGEVIEYVSLGAGNTGRDFDLETNRRIAEFKFINWRGGPESIRQNQLFKDFYLLSESASPKQKYLYVLGTEYPLKFFNGRRALASVLSRNDALLRQFKVAYGDKYSVVRDYYIPRRNRVDIVDVSSWIPELIADDES